MQRGALKPDGDAAARFEPHRRRLLGLAYRMLGSVSDAEDMVQEAFLRWREVDRGAIAEPGAYLARVVTRLCLDHLKSARARREIYVGPWLPEPLVDDLGLAEDGPAGVAHDLSIALLLALERLSPLERASFLLHDVFEEDFESIAETLGRSAEACRQLAARARVHLRSGQPRYTVSPEEENRIAAAFQAALATGNAAGLAAVLAEDAVLRTDGGGRRVAALNPIFGRDKIVRFFVSLARKRQAFARLRPARINGHPGFVTTEPDGALQTFAIEIEGGRIAAIYSVRNPDKLRHLASAAD